MFNLNFFKGKLQSVKHFRVFNAFSFLSFLSSGGILFGMEIIFTTSAFTIDQKFLVYTDTTLMTTVNIFLAILNSKKGDDFFD